jgi:thiamine kinase-like enzyme
MSGRKSAIPKRHTVNPGERGGAELKDEKSWNIRVANGFSTLGLQKICLTFKQIAGSSGTRSLKSSPDKKVLFVDNKENPLLIKAQLYPSLSGRLKSTIRYLLYRTKPATSLAAEFINSKTANTRKLRTSRVLGYGCRFSSGLISQELLVTEACSDGMPLLQRLRQHEGNDTDTEKYLQRAFLLIEHMLKAGYVHLDLHSDNILITSSEPGNDVLIDFEFASHFPDERLPDVAAFVYGYLFRCQVREHISYERYTVLVEQAIESLAGEQWNRNSFMKNFHLAATARIAKKKRQAYLKL